MLLRRFTGHIKDQNWFAVGLDFLIVVFAIFAGFQVDNWNEARKERVEEREYLLRLYNDASASIALSESQRDFIVSHADRAGIVMRDLNACRVSPPARVDFVNGLFHLGKLFPPYMVSGTVDELRSTGKLSILENVSLRAQLNETIAVYDEFSRIFSMVEGRIEPHVNYVDSVVVYKTDEPLRGNAELRWEDVEFDLEMLCTDRRFYTAVAAVRNYAYDVAAWHNETIEAISKFKSALATELRLSVSDEPQAAVR